MPENPIGEESERRDGLPSLLEDVLGIVPRLIDRTSAQVQFSQTVLSMLPCARRLVAGPRIDDGEVPSHEAPQPADVLTILEQDETRQADPLRADSAIAGQAVGDEADDPLAPNAAMRSTSDGNGSAFASGNPPAVEELAIPDYDSLAASQVVPRLTTLAPEELRAVGDYEAAHRSRRTILNRVTALLAD